VDERAARKSSVTPASGGRPELRTALATITRHVDHYAEQARLPRAA
jgi:hypothetical protein